MKLIDRWIKKSQKVKELEEELTRMNEQVISLSAMVEELRNQVTDILEIKKDIVAHEEAVKEEQEKKHLRLQSDKQKATDAKEPWVAVVSMDVDPDNVADGSFELDWNEFFIAKLVKAGYKGETDADMVDHWFTEISQKMAYEIFEQNMNLPRQPTVISTKLDDNKTEYK